jgi:hypothetical protein
MPVERRTGGENSKRSSLNITPHSSRHAQNYRETPQSPESGHACDQPRQKNRLTLDLAAQAHGSFPVANATHEQNATNKSQQVTCVSVIVDFPLPVSNDFNLHFFNLHISDQPSHNN